MGSMLDSVGNIGDVLAAIEAGRASGRYNAALLNQSQARGQADIYRTQMDAALKGPAMSAKQVALGDTLSNIKPFEWTGETKMSGNIPIPQSTGGLGPQNFGPATRQAGADLASVAGSRITSPSFNLPEPPKLEPLPEASGLDSILNKVGPIASLLGALNGGGGPGGASGNLGKLIQDIANKLRRGQGGSVQGNKPAPGGAMTGGLPADWTRGFEGWDTSVSDPSGNPYLLSDPGVYYGGGGGASPTDPSGGTGVGPGMQAYYEWLLNGGSDTYGDDTGTDWWDE